MVHVGNTQRLLLALLVPQNPEKFMLPLEMEHDLI